MKARKLKSGNWNVQYPYLDEHGVKRRGSLTRPTKEEAEYEGDKIRLMQSNVMAGTVAIVVEKAFRDKAAVLSPSTLKGYMKVLEYNIENAPFGWMKIQAVESRHVQEWITWMIVKGYSPKSIKNAYGVFLSAYKYCGGIKNFMVKLPRLKKERKHVPARSDVKAILDYFADDKEMTAAVCLGAFAGLRRGEVCALTARDVNRTKHTIRVNKAIANTIDKEWVVKLPKTESSNRVVPVGDRVINALPKEGQCVNLNPGQVTNRLIRAVEELGITHFSFHDLRHFYATLSHNCGVSDINTAMNAGWSSPTTMYEFYLGEIEEERAMQTAALNNFIDENF